jgi:hypothetical protein
LEALIRSIERDLEKLDIMTLPHRGDFAEPTEARAGTPGPWLSVATEATPPGHAPSPPASARPVRQASFRSPWEIHSFRDLFSFFGPMLSVLAAAQIYSAWMLSRIAATNGFKWLDLGGVRLAGIIALGFLACDAVFLRVHFGKTNTLVFPWVLGLAGGSGVFALSCHVAARFF